MINKSFVKYIRYGARPLRMRTDATHRGEAVKLHANDCWLACQEDNTGCVLTLIYSGQGAFPLRAWTQSGESDLRKSA